MRKHGLTSDMTKWLSLFSVSKKNVFSSVIVHRVAILCSRLVYYVVYFEILLKVYILKQCCVQLVILVILSFSHFILAQQETSVVLLDGMHKAWCFLSSTSGSQEALRPQKRLPLLVVPNALPSLFLLLLTLPQTGVLSIFLS